jgi:hypothetical protein
MAIGIDRGARHQAVVTGEWICRIERSRRRGVVEADVGVMHHARVAGEELDSAHVALAQNRQWDREDPKDIGRLGLERIRGRDADNKIGHPELPFLPSQP